MYRKFNENSKKLRNNGKNMIINEMCILITVHKKIHWFVLTIFDAEYQLPWKKIENKINSQ